MDLFEVISTNRAIRHFRPEPVPDDLIERVLDAAIRAPSGSNRQTWRFLVLRDPAVRATVGTLYKEGFYEYIPERRRAMPDTDTSPVFKSALSLADTMATDPPVLILACLEGKPGDPPAGRTGGSSIYPAVQNLMLAARALGLGTCLTTLHLRRERQIKDALGIPDHVDTYALIPLGYPARPFGPLGRRPVGEVTYLDRWGATAGTMETA
ncbi:MAG: nitroreductase family protein [Chloroflexi bacterium]|nr:nitroreductase family protein [Chloroflexota bacterium]